MAEVVIILFVEASMFLMLCELQRGMSVNRRFICKERASYSVFHYFSAIEATTEVEVKFQKTGVRNLLLSICSIT